MKTVCIFMCFIFVLPTLAQVNQRLAPPPNLGRPYETTTNKTMDEIILGSMGGVGVASNMILADGNHILAELDMFLTMDQFRSMYQPPDPEQMQKIKKAISEDLKPLSGRSKRKAASSTNRRWTKAEIPYLFAKGHFDNKEEYLMRRSMTEWERYTCLKFRPATSNDKNSVRFQNGVGCNSQLGMIGGIQTLNLQAPGCRYKGLYLHEIGHAIGLVHEHQLPDRDSYISILYQNVEPNMRVWFNKYTTKEVNQMNVPYEYSSVMHYGVTAFAFDGKAQTIRAYDQSKEKTIGQVHLKELSYTDVQIVNLMYNCSSHCPNQNQCGANGHLDQKCQCICKDGSSDCDRSKTGSSSNCVNNYDSWSCYIWANQGECERNPFYMKQQCAKACGVCGSQTTTSIGCKDVYAEDKCKVWKVRGDCATNKGWMKTYCKATCDLCDTNKPTECKNEHTEPSKCDEWARDGECSVNTQWMFGKCKLSCGMCGVTTIDPGEGDGEVDQDNMACENLNSYCGKFAQSGECEKNPSWMIPNCRKACNKCDDDTCKNLYNDVQCQIWAQKLECLTNSDWMGKHCAKECMRGPCERVVSSVQTTTTVAGTKSTTQSSVTKIVTTAASCRNIHKSSIECDIWARSDHCSINPGWMLKNCAKSCKVCSSGTGSVNMTTTTTKIVEEGTVTADACENIGANCDSWAKHGNCDTNPGYNLKYCKKACNNCNGCRDTNFLCGIWAKDDHCQKNKGYMLRNCQKSCKTCVMSSDDPGDEGNVSNIGPISAQPFWISSFLLYVVYIFLS